MEAAPAVMKGSSFDVLTSMVFLQLAFSQAYMTTKSLFALPRRLIMPDIFFFLFKYLLAISIPGSSLQLFSL